MHIHNHIDSLSQSFSSPLLPQPAVLITQQRQARERKAETERPQTRGRSTPTAGCSLLANSQRVTDPGTCCAVLARLTHLALPLLSAREV